MNIKVYFFSYVSKFFFLWGQPQVNSCPGNNINLASCSISNPASIYDFKFTTCTVATVSTISASSGSVGDSITITGAGFSTTACENEVLIGSYSCPITSSSATQIVCQIGSNSGLIPGIKYGIEVQIKNSGNSIQNSWYAFNFIPKITSITPNIGELLNKLYFFIEFFYI